MSTTFDGDKTISSTDVIERIDELQEKLDSEERFEVRSNYSSKVLGVFRSEDEAQEFIEEEDYVPERVFVNVLDSEVDEEELEELKKLNDDGRSLFGSDWTYGVTFTSEDIMDEDFAKEQARGRGESWSSEIEGYIDWDRYLEDLLDGSSYVTLNRTNYYNL